MHERHVEARLERGRVERDGAAAELPAPLRAELAIGPHLHRAALRPGHGAAHEQQVLRGMISTTVRPRWVIRPPPIRPGPRMPLNTRDGVAEAPIDPGARTLCEPCDFGPLAKLWRLIVPWKPLPFDVPETFTRSPTENASTVTVSPTEQLTGLVAELSEIAMGRGVGLLQMTELGLRERLLLARPERQLDGLIAVALERADPGDRTRARPRARSRVRSCRRRGTAGSFRASWPESLPSRLRKPGESRYPRRPGDGRDAGASRPSSGSAGGCRSVACGCGSRSARASPCP